VVSLSAPAGRKAMISGSMGDVVSSALGNVFGMVTGKDKKETTSSSSQGEEESSVKKTSASATSIPDITMEDVLSWMPPTPHLLTEATLLLFRLTINGSIYGRDERWQELGVAWEKTLSIEKKYANTTDKILFKGFSPLSRIAIHIALERPLPDWKDEHTVSSKLEKAATLLSEQLQINRSEFNPTKADDANGWKEISALLLESRNKWSRLPPPLPSPSTIPHPTIIQPIHQDFDGLHLNLHNFTEHALCYAALRSSDDDVLRAARSVCSESIVMRPCSPETWWRYGLLLEELGDYAAAEDARAASVSFGSGEGGEVALR